MIAKTENTPERSKGRVERHSPNRLLHKPVQLPGGVTVSAERHNGRLMVRVESPIDEGLRVDIGRCAD
jgi:hypothetical protein